MKHSLMNQWDQLTLTFCKINLTTAKVLGLIFPDKLLALADEVIEKGASFAVPLTAVSWCKTSAGDVCSDVSDGG
jgi:hypothetical protein